MGLCVSVSKVCCERLDNLVGVCLTWFLLCSEEIQSFQLLHKQLIWISYDQLSPELIKT